MQVLFRGVDENTDINAGGSDNFLGAVSDGGGVFLTTPSANATNTSAGSRKDGPSGRSFTETDPDPLARVADTASAITSPSTLGEAETQVGSEAKKHTSARLCFSGGTDIDIADIQLYIIQYSL
jgi:hypothetical protein